MQIALRVLFLQLIVLELRAALSGGSCEQNALCAYGAQYKVLTRSCSAFHERLFKLMQNLW